ncbi:MAG: hypothetical protein CMC25_00005, partial [Flavobacteriaceae bacterium]|nr:hypothetical protein [Flavobacteriaceae bacterium]
AGFDVSDLSDDGIDTDGNLVNDKTITLLNIQTGVEVVKTAVLNDDGDGLPSAGDVITYTIVILNTGNVTLENINLTDIHKRGPFASGTVVPFDSGPTFTSATAGSSSTLILAGGQLTYTATYTVVGADITAGLMSNRATIAADDVTAANNSVSDNSDDGDDLDGNTTDDPTVVKLTYDGKLDISKTVQVTQADSNKIQLGDTAVYTIVVTNTGNVRLTSIALNDQLSGVNGVSLSLNSPGVKFLSSSGGSASGTLEVGESASYTATFTVNQEAIDQTGFQNTVEATGRDPANALVSDDSDDGDDTDGNRLNDPTVTPIPADPSIDVVKTSSHQDLDGDGEISAGDRINYTITISNTGNNTLGADGAPSGELVVQDIVSTIAGTHTPTLVGPSFVSSSLGSNFGVIKPNEMAIFSAYVIITQDIVNAGGLSNIASVTAQDPSNTAVTDTSDDGDDNDGNLTDDATIDGIPANPSINIVKTVTVSDTNGNGINDIGDVANYTITISNTGNIDISSIVVTDTLTGLSTGTLSLTQSLTFVSATRGSNSDVILVNEQANYTAKFTINQNAADLGGMRNVVTVSGIDNANSTTISDTSENIDTVIIASPSITVTKTVAAVDNDSDSEIGVGDTLVYTITILNTGNQALKDFTFTETFKDLENNSRSLSSSITTADPNELAPGQTKTYSATYVITQSDVDNGGLSNSVVVVASNITDNIFVNDTSDDGDTGAGNTNSDPTLYQIAANPSLDVTKTFVNNDLNGDGIISTGDKLTYTILVKNTGNITQASLYVTDVITDLASNTRNLDNSNLPVFVSNSMSSTQGTLKSGEVATFTATYTIVAGDVTAGGVINQATAKTFYYPNGINPVLRAQDVSDDGDDTDGNTTNDRTISYTGTIPSFVVIKTATKVDDGNGIDNAGDQVVFTITVSNTSVDQINNLEFVDTITSSRGNSMSLVGTPTFISATSGSNSTTLTVNGTITFTATFTVNDLSIKDGGLFNTITFKGSSARNPFPGELDTKDISDDGNTGAGDTGDDPTFVPLGTDSDSDGIPDNLDIDDDNDGVLDTFEQCIDFNLDGTSFETYYKPGSPVNPAENKNSQFPAKTVAPPFTSVNGDGEIWDNRTDGNNVNWSPAPGLGANSYFIELLQNAFLAGTSSPTNKREYWNETSSGIGDFDRIMVEEVVYPSTTYTIKFYHKDGGLLEASHGNGGSTLLQVQSMQTDFAVDQLTVAPTSWAQQTFQFTTDANTHRIAILFSAYAPGVNVSIQLDGISIEPQETCQGDIDNDSVGNGLDLDSDNDGIYDVIESGNGAFDTNNDGRIDSNDTGFVDNNDNGAHDSIESRTPTDTDSDTTVDMFDLDSDNDNCNDSKEAGYTDGDNDGKLGNSPITQDANGKVTSGSDGYTIPLDQNSNGIKDYQEVSYDVACFSDNLTIDMTKSAEKIDVNSDGVLGLNDKILYTVVVTNTGAISYTIQLTDVLTNESSQTIQNLDLEFVGLTTPTTFNVPENLLKRSAGFNYTSNNSFSNSLWHKTGADDNNRIEMIQTLRTQPAEALVYFTPSSGATENQSKLSTGLQVLPKLQNGNYKSLVTKSPPGFANLTATNPSYNHFIRFRNQNNYSNESDVNSKKWFYQEVSGLQPNTQYTVSVFAYPYNSSQTGSDTFNKGFQFVFHDGGTGQTWTDIDGNFLTNWNNAQKSPRFYFQEQQVYRFSHTFTTDSSVDITRVGIAPPYAGNVGAWFYGIQLEEGPSMSPVYTYTYNNAVSATTASIEADPKVIELGPGNAATYQVTLTLTQSIVDNHQKLVNTATVTGTFTTPAGISLQATSTSDDPSTLAVDDPTIVNLTVTPSVEITKTASVTDVDSSGNVNLGDIITYTITVSNTGQTPLNNIDITDSLSGLDTGTLSLSTTLTFISSTAGSPSNTLAVGEVSTFMVTFTVNQDAVNFGGTRNVASVEASAPRVIGGTQTVTDTSLNIDHPISKSPSITVTKTVQATDNDLDGEIGVGDSLLFTISILNTGDVTLKDFDLNDTFTDLDTNTLSFSTSLTTTDPNELAPGQIKTYTVTYTLNASSVDNGGVVNSVVVSATDVQGLQTVSDTSDDGLTGGGDTGADPTVYSITSTPSLEVTKTVSETDLDGDGLVSAGDKLIYTVKVKNNGNVTLRSIYLEDVLTDISSNTRSLDGSGIVFNSSSNGSPFRTLIVDEVATYTATYTIVAGDVTAGGVMNQVIARAYVFPEGVQTLHAIDHSDDGDDTDGNTQNDKTITFTGVLNSFEVTKTAAKVDDGNGVDNVGDKIVFTITVSNTGTDQIDGLTFVDTLTSARGATLSLDSTPVFVSGTNASTATTLTVGGVITYTATFTVNQLSLDEGGVFNTITFNGSSARNPESTDDTSDVSDDGDDTDGNTEDDPTFFAVGLDNDGDGIPDLLDIDDDNDGVLDSFEKCIDFQLDGTSFDNYDTGGGPVNTATNFNSKFPLSNVVSPFSSVDGRGRIWDARFVNGVNWAPQAGQFFMELLQSATISGTSNPSNTRTYWNETTHGIEDFDRIMVQEFVYPNTTYNLTYYHMDGGISSSTYADGASTLVQVQGMDSDFAVDQLAVTPSAWTQQTFQFTTGPNTHRIAVLLSAYAPGSNVAILVDSIVLSSQVTLTCDVDGDSKGNGIDIDSDNDGIYDVKEAGYQSYDTNGDGMIDANDTGFVDANSNGAHDAIEGLSPTNTTTATVVDLFNLDSDNDGCNDVIEAGFTDPNGDGKLGGNPVTVNSKGKVTSGSDGYTALLDQNSNGVEDYVDTTWDINCLNPGLSITKAANPIDLDGDGLIQVNDQIVYTIIVTNTSEVSVTFTLSDTLSNQLSQTILQPELVWLGTSSNVNIKPPFNYIKKSSNFSFNGNYNTWDSSYWHIDYAHYN